jgi:carotenoid cleavage dioxygenase-like enzyme
MSKAFPTDEPFLRGVYAPLHMECDADHLPVSGELPAELNGRLYRNGPNPQFAPRGPYHWFSGDGMLHAFHIEGGRASYRNRWVRTPKWALEHAEGEGLSGAFGNPRFSDRRIVALNSTLANTNVVWHAGRLLALEEAHAPFEGDPLTLAPKGYCRFGDQLDGPMTAHPKLDAATGEMAVTDAVIGREDRNGLAHVDLATGTVRLWQPAPSDLCGEPVFVPRHHHAQEGDGFLLSVVYRGETKCSDLAILDAADLAAGPIALVHLSHRVPAGFHGNWRSD